MKYIRTKDGRIVDIEKFINEEKDTPYYKDFIFEEITKDGVLKWTAIGTEQNSMEEQIGIRCHFSATLNSEVIKQAETIEELCDDFIGVLDNGNGSHIWYDEEYLAITEWETQEELSALKFKYAKANLSLNEILYGAIWTSKGLIFVAKKNEEGKLELL